VKKTPPPPEDFNMVSDDEMRRDLLAEAAAWIARRAAGDKANPARDAKAVFIVTEYLSSEDRKRGRRGRFDPDDQIHLDNFEQTLAQARRIHEFVPKKIKRAEAIAKFLGVPDSNWLCKIVAQHRVAWCGTAQHRGVRDPLDMLVAASIFRTGDDLDAGFRRLDALRRRRLRNRGTS
jgi:hypothetical protein